MRIVNKSEMVEVESLAKQEYGFSESLIIENIGIRAAEYIHETYLQDESYGELVVLVGKGNNGADGMALARHLRRYNFTVRAFLLFPSSDFTQELQRQVKMAQSYGVKVSETKGHEQILSYFTQTQNSYFVIDAIFGTGVRLPLSNFLFDVIKVANKFSDTMISVDIPTGVCADTGRVKGNAIKATETLAIGIPKIGHYVNQGPSYVGDLKIIDAGLPNELLNQGNKILLNSSYVANLAKKRDPFAYKNVFGHTLVIGGSHGLTGALILSSKAALKVGSGLVTALTWENCFHELASRVDAEIITGTIPDDDQIAEQLQRLSRFDSVVIGPGLGRSDQTRANLIRLLNSFNGPLVIDADAINALSFEEDKKVLASRKAPTIMTPHIGEFARFMNCQKEELQEKPLEFLQEFVEGTSCFVLLKGPCTYIGLPSNELFVHYSPNSGMATGGTGDVLAGVIGGLFAQAKFNSDADYLSELPKFYANTCLGVMVHSVAGLHAVKNYGERAMVAGNIIEYLTEAFSEIRRSGKDYEYEHHDFEEL